MKLLFIDIDTMRPDHMSCYGYNRTTTPNIDQVANDGIRFNRYYCSDAPCLPSRAALMSGRFGIHNGAVGHGGTAGDMALMGKDRGFVSQYDEHCFHALFRKAGMKTVSISTFPERHSSYWFSAFCNETYNVGGQGMESGEKVIPVALDWLKRNKDVEDWYLHVHFWDPHTPYRAPAEFGNPFENEPLNVFVDEGILEEHKKHGGPHGVNEINMWNDNTDPMYPRHPGKITNMKDLKRFFDGYDTGILYADSLVGQIIDELKAQGIYDETAIIVTSDHGENMGELAIYGEHGTADQPTCHIPMILKWPNGPKNAVDDAFHYNLDLVPTMADLLGLEKWEKWDGNSYAETILEGKTCGREHLVVSQMAHVCQRSAIFGDWLYIRTYHDGYHLFDDEMLFNLKDDPYEQDDVKEQYPEKCAIGAKIILDFVDKNMKNSDQIVDPLWRIMSEGGPHHAHSNNVDINKFLQRLETTGRQEQAYSIRQKYSL